MELIKTSDFSVIYDDMLFQFPASEMKSLEKFQSISGDNYYIYKIIEKVPVGYVVIFEYLDFIFIDYIAVYKEFHSQGFGGKILERLRELFKDKKGCFLEVEKPDLENFNTIRRIDFYQKHGAKKLDINYLYPNEKGFLPMDLYYISYGSEPSYYEIKSFITKLFEVVHKDIKHSEEILAKILKKM